MAKGKPSYTYSRTYEDKTLGQRQQAYRKRKEAQGFTQISAWVRAEDVAFLKELGGVQAALDRLKALLEERSGKL
jgi:hypothetical protein